MAQNLIIRNITPATVELKLIEIYAAVTPNVNLFTRLASNVTTAVGVSLPGVPETNPEILEGTEPFSKDETSLTLAPFTISSTDKASPEQSEIVRLTFEIDGQRYRTDLPLTGGRSKDLIPLGPDPRYKIAAIYIPGDAFLALFSAAVPTDWMAELQDSTAISALSIPGTHNSPTCFTALPSVRCQAVNPRAQLDGGIRFFDIRVQPESPEDLTKDGLILVHGVFPISLTGSKYIRGLIDNVEAFLAAHPRETVILSIKREGPGEHTDQQLAQILRDHYARDEEKWYLEPHIPRLGEVRGKMVLMRRFALDDAGKQAHEGRGWGINAESWQYNCEHDDRGEIVVQDFCEVLETTNINKKISASCEQLGRSGRQRIDENVSPLFLNFLSASNFWWVDGFKCFLYCDDTDIKQEHRLLAF